MMKGYVDLEGTIDAKPGDRVALLTDGNPDTAWIQDALSKRPVLAEDGGILFEGIADRDSNWEGDSMKMRKTPISDALEEMREQAESREDA